jgi:predicted SAM-dependent methyltransferase
MESYLKKVLSKIVNKFGYTINKTPRIYENHSNYNAYSKESLANKRFYNIGAGKFSHSFWTNIDYKTEHYKNVQNEPFIHYDLMELGPLPIQDNFAELVYSSHTIEHVNDEAVKNLLKESFRILKPGGGIRLTTPNAWIEFQAYKRNDISYWYWKDLKDTRLISGKQVQMCKIPIKNASIHQLFLHHIASQLSEIGISPSHKKFSDNEIKQFFETKKNVDCLDFFTKQCVFDPNYPGQHINWWTSEKLCSFLREAGFTQPYVSGWGQSLFAPLRDTNFFDNTHPKISLYVEAIKES